MPVLPAGAGLDPVARLLADLRLWVPATAVAGLGAYRVLALRAKTALDALGAEEEGRQLTLPEAARTSGINASGLLISVSRIAIVFDDDAIGILSLRFMMPGETDPYVVTLARFH